MIICFAEYRRRAYSQLICLNAECSCTGFCEKAQLAVAKLQKKLQTRYKFFKMKNLEKGSMKSFMKSPIKSAWLFVGLTMNCLTGS